MIAFVGVLNGFDFLREALRALDEATSPDCGIVLLDNGSDTPLEREPWLPDRAIVFRSEENLGNWALFGWALRALADHGHAPDVVAVLHSDLFIWERDWDRRTLAAFRADPLLGLAGFVGARGLAGGGGRHLTMLNFQGRAPWGSPAEWHGDRIAGLEPAAAVDGCAMVFRTAALRAAWDPDWPPHHFYDKELSCRILAAGLRVGAIGVACDHMGGQTACKQPQYFELCRRWCEAHGLRPEPDHPDNWDLAVYRESERRFLRRWEQEQSFLPVNVGENWEVRHG